MNAAQYGRLARAEARKLLTTRALPVTFAAAAALTLVSVVVQAMVAGRPGTYRLGTDDSTYQLLKIGAVPCLAMLIIGIVAAGGEFRHHTIIPALLATPGRARVFAVKVAVVAVTAAAFGQRRKMLRQSLKPLLPEDAILAAGIDPTRRAETLSVSEFAALARQLRAR